MYGSTGVDVWENSLSARIWLATTELGLFLEAWTLVQLFYKILCVFMFCIEILQNSVGRYGAYCAQHAVTLKCKQASESPGLGWFMKATGSQLEFHPTFAGLALVSWGSPGLRPVLACLQGSQECPIQPAPTPSKHSHRHGPDFAHTPESSGNLKAFGEKKRKRKKKIIKILGQICTGVIRVHCQAPESQDSAVNTETETLSPRVFL